MNQKYNTETIDTIVKQHHSGTPVTLLSAEHDIPRSTIYTWIKQQADSSESSNQDYQKLKRQHDKLAEQLEIIKRAGCALAAPLDVKLETLENLYGEYSVHALCGALNVSRGTFYNHIFRRKIVTQYDIRREEIREQVKDVFDESKQRFGSKKIRAILAERGIRTSNSYVAELMREMNLQSIGRNSKREHIKQTGRDKQRNILQQRFNASEPNRVWVSDTTCFKIKEKYYYICVVIDLFSRKVISYGISLKHGTYLVSSTIKRAIVDRSHPKQLTFHSDRGFQYMSRSVRRLLAVNNIVQSFSRSGRPHDNAVAESFFSAMKKEELYRTNFKSEREFISCVAEYILFYNSKRPHGTLGYKTPARFEELHYSKNKKAD